MEQLRITGTNAIFVHKPQQTIANRYKPRIKGLHFFCKGKLTNSPITVYYGLLRFAEIRNLGVNLGAIKKLQLCQNEKKIGRLIQILAKILIQHYKVP
jgi:hypothetical protein